MNKFVKCLALTSATGVAILTTSSPAKAALLTWYLDGVTFDDGGTASGSFQFDSDTNQAGNVNISVTGGSALSASDYELSGLVNANIANFFGLRNSDNRFFQVVFEFDSSLTNAGGTVAINTTRNLSFEATCGDLNCSFLTDPGRFITAGTVTAVPEPLTILGVGTALAFGTGFKRKLGKGKKK